MIRINITSVMVDDQAKAERFYTEVLGFEKNLDIPVHGARFLTVKNSDGSGVDLFLEPAGYEFAKVYQKALFDNGVAATSLGCDDIDAEYERLKGLGVPFRTPPKAEDETGFRFAVFEDGCGNLIMLTQET
ncbi:VOC family protein [Chelativorans sp. ZYF759]|uniref:VOC family protein n=1 Tax=Chelativorans sp. ZYF759 TaxID=2692213 RepID=UPI00145DC0C5|nr:VOC family protein [Chelativorans sp. ZYF759]NMG40410.1 VOC family protein [Chelativorans sp. ZYF759]